MKNITSNEMRTTKGSMRGKVLEMPTFLQRTHISAPKCLVHRKLTVSRTSKNTIKCQAAEVATPAPAKTQRQQREIKVKMSDIRTGDEFEGTVVAVEAYGAFVNIGTSVDGLVHVSQLSSGFVKKASDIVKPGEIVRVKVVSMDMAKNRLGLSMKNVSSASSEESEEEISEEEPEMVQEEQEAATESLDMKSLIPEGLTPVSSSLAGFEDFVALMPEEYAENMTQEDLDEIAREDVEVEYECIPVLELFTGNVSRVEDFGVFVDFTFKGKKMSGLLHCSEMKAPASKVEGLGESYAGEKYIDVGDISNAADYYAVDDEVEVLYLGTEENNKIVLSQFMDWEVTEDEEDILASSPEKELEAIDQEDAEEGIVEVSTDNEELYTKVYDNYKFQSGAAAAVGLMTNKFEYKDAMLTNFPSRPVSVSSLSQVLSPMRPTELDIDCDTLALEDVWSSEWTIPSNILQKTGMRLQDDGQGGVTVIEKEGAKQPSDIVLADLLNLDGSLNTRVQSFLADLMADDEDEAELPKRAYRRPGVFAAAVATISAAVVKQLRDKTGAGMMDCKKALAECNGDMEASMKWLRKKGLAGADKKAGRVAAEGALISYIHPGSRLGVLLEINSETDFVAAGDAFLKLANEIAMITAASPDVVCVNPEDMPEELLAKEREVEMGKEDLKSKPEAVRAKVVEGRLEKMRNSRALVNQDSLRDPTKTVKDIVKETIAAVGENIQIRRFVKYQLGEGLEKRSNDFAAEVAQQTAAKAEPKPKAAEPPKEKVEEAAKPAIQVAASVVKQLRDKTGAGMMDCKKALAECNGDMDASIEWLRKKGLAGADKKMGRIAAEGAIASYIHPGSRLGVMLEVNCETDFVAASEKFDQLVKTIAMQIAASPGVAYVTADEIPAEVFEREKQIEMGREDLKSKPEAIRAKIAEGRTQKLVQEMVLMNQTSLADSSKTIGDLVKEAIAAIGEKVSVRRFVKWQLGEGLEKKSTDFAAEVAAATGSK